MDENDGCGLEIHDGSPEALEALLAGRCTCGAHPPGPHREQREDLPEPRSETARIFADWLDRTAPRRP
jgi:hypothetical protein